MIPKITMLTPAAPEIVDSAARYGAGTAAEPNESNLHFPG